MDILKKNTKKQLQSSNGQELKNHQKQQDYIDSLKEIVVQVLVRFLHVKKQGNQQIQWDGLIANSSPNTLAS